MCFLSQLPTVRKQAEKAHPLMPLHKWLKNKMIKKTFQKVEIRATENDEIGTYSWEVKFRIIKKNALLAG